MTKPIDRAVAKDELDRINAVLKQPHLLIGGLAVQQYHPARVSKDIDLVCDFDTAQHLLKTLYPSRDWKVIDKQNDEYRPSFQIVHKVDELGTIIFGPKISEREPYAHIDWKRLGDGAMPFHSRTGTLENIIVPAPHALAYTKYISFLGRRAPQEKIQADLQDLVDLSNHEAFSASLFFDLLRRSKAFDELIAAFQTKAAEFPDILEMSCLAGLAQAFSKPRQAMVTHESPTVGFGIAERQVFDVSTAHELLYAIGSDRVLELKEGEFDLSSVVDQYLKHVRWERTRDGYAIAIRDVHNLTIRGKGAARTRIVASPASADVLTLDRCVGVEIVDLTMGHVPDGQCSGGVLSAVDCRNVRLDRCGLFGCGIEGLTLRGVDGFYARNSEIFKCTYGIATLESCRRISFIEMTFHHNEQFHGFSIRDSEDVEFIQSIFDSNRLSGDLFEVTSSSRIRFVRGRIFGNTCTGIGEIEIHDSDVQAAFIDPPRWRRNQQKP